MVGGIILDKGRGRSRCVAVSLTFAVHPLRARAAACKTTLTGWVDGGWYYIG